MTAADALHALKVHLTPLFDPSAVLVATSPAGKANELAISLGLAHAGEPLPVIAEEDLPKLSGGGAKVDPAQFVRRETRVTGESAAESAPTTSGTGLSTGGHAKSMQAKINGTYMSKQFKCECPKCDPAFQAKIAFLGQGLPMS